MRCRFPVGQVNPRIARGVPDRGADAIAPGALVLVARRGEGCPRKLLSVKAVIAFLRAVHTLRQGTGQGFCLEIVSEAGHVSGMGARNGHCLYGFLCRGMGGHDMSSLSTELTVEFVTNKL